MKTKRPDKAKPRTRPKPVSHKSFIFYKDGGKNGKKIGDEHHLVHEKGKILCMTCNGHRVANATKMKEHIVSKKHKVYLDEQS